MDSTEYLVLKKEGILVYGSLSDDAQKRGVHDLGPVLQVFSHVDDKFEIHYKVSGSDISRLSAINDDLKEIIRSGLEKPAKGAGR